MIFKKIVSKISARIEGFKQHPLTRKEVGAAVYRYLSFNVVQTFYPKPRIYNFIGDLKFYAQKGEAGIVANIYYKLFDYEDSMFLIDHLQENDLFIDIGANVGHFSLIAAGICKSNVIAIEPIPSTFSRLKKNVDLNNLSKRIQIHNIGIGEENSYLNFTSNRDVMNGVALGHETDIISIKVVTLDEVLKAQSPTFLKIDVEGYEYFVLKGASNVLSNQSLKFIIVELNFSTSKFGHTNQEIVELLLSYDFFPIEYEVEQKKVKLLSNYSTNKFNTIFIRKDLTISYND
jgi:FkbM family methyltransferase